MNPDYRGIWIAVVLALLVRWDARRIGVQKGRLEGSLFDLSPWGWFWGCLLLFPVFLPAYLLKRPEYKRLNENVHIYHGPYD